MAQPELTEATRTREPVTAHKTTQTPGPRNKAREQVRGLHFEEGQKVLSPAAAEAPKPAAELGSALVLSADPALAKESSVNWFASRIKEMAAAWGLGFDATAVRLARGADGATVVALDWPAGLGPAPATRVMPDTSLTPVDARLAMAAVPALPGWARMAPGDQGKLGALLQGETNAVSAATRNYLRPKYLDMKTRPEAEQQAALSATIGHKDASPSLVQEPVETDPVSVTVSGPTEVAQYEFRGTKADAHVFTATYGDGTTLRIVAPKAPDPAYHQHTVTQAAQAARYLPKKMRELLKEILLNPITNPEDAYWAAQYNMPDFHSYMTAGTEGVVTVYPMAAARGQQPPEEAMRGTLMHETGHTWSYRAWGTDKNQGKWLDWKKAMDSDGMSVSGYARVDIAEDVAETIQAYGSTKGKPRFEEYKKIVPARFTILEKEIG